LVENLCHIQNERTKRTEDSCLDWLNCAVTLAVCFTPPPTVDFINFIHLQSSGRGSVHATLPSASNWNEMSRKPVGYSRRKKRRFIGACLTTPRTRRRVMSSSVTDCSVIVQSPARTRTPTEASDIGFLRFPQIEIVYHAASLRRRASLSLSLSLTLVEVASQFTAISRDGSVQRARDNLGDI